MKCKTSIIIAAHNEAHNLQKNLPFIFTQQNVEFEIIVIDDRSTDNTSAVLNSFQNEKLKVLKIKNLPKGITGKKNALTEGIKIAQYENLLFTDADCKPISENWAFEMIAPLKENDLVLGISQYENNNTFLSEFIQFETLFTAIQYIGFSKIGMPYMGVGRNIAYKKTLFFQNKGFASHQDVLGGDDDLFVGEVAKNAKIQWCTKYNAQTISEPKKTWKTYFEQKRRHLSVGLKYNWKNKFVVGVFQQMRLWFYLFCLVSFFFFPLKENFALILFTFASIFEGLIFFYLKRKWNFKLKIHLFFVYNLLYLFYFLSTGISVIFIKKRKWQ